MDNLDYKYECTKRFEILFSDENSEDDFPSFITFKIGELYDKSIVEQLRDGWQDDYFKKVKISNKEERFKIEFDAKIVFTKTLYGITEVKKITIPYHADFPMCHTYELSAMIVENFKQEKIIE
jgi:hypothetical protein